MLVSVVLSALAVAATTVSAATGPSDGFVKMGRAVRPHNETARDETAQNVGPASQHKEEWHGQPASANTTQMSPHLICRQVGKSLKPTATATEKPIHVEDSVNSQYTPPAHMVAAGLRKRASCAARSATQTSYNPPATPSPSPSDKPSPSLSDKISPAPSDTHSLSTSLDDAAADSSSSTPSTPSTKKTEKYASTTSSDHFLSPSAIASPPPVASPVDAQESTFIDYVVDYTPVALPSPNQSLIPKNGTVGGDMDVKEDDSKKPAKNATSTGSVSATPAHAESPGSAKPSPEASKNSSSGSSSEAAKPTSSRNGSGQPEHKGSANQTADSSSEKPSFTHSRTPLPSLPVDFLVTLSASSTKTLISPTDPSPSSTARDSHPSPSPVDAKADLSPSESKSLKPTDSAHFSDDTHPTDSADSSDNIEPTKAPHSSHDTEPTKSSHSSHDTKPTKSSDYPHDIAPTPVPIVGNATLANSSELISNASALLSNSSDALSGSGPVGAISDILIAHNLARAAYMAQPLNWSASLAASAQVWAKGCVWQHDAYGQNLAGEGGKDNSSSQNGTSVVASWMSEVSLYNASNPVANDKYSHFTQVVWANSTQVGCYQATCATFVNGTGVPVFPTVYLPAVYTVCDYYPPGNVPDEFAVNVQIPDDPSPTVMEAAESTEKYLNPERRTPGPSLVRDCGHDDTSFGSLN
ncbi:MAG: hypothetical protein CYPHOPRED_002485 [Cyphobasidiales sp. Tagirdzhanova-0007]|nr:MAG: hypothetical protein CYPHOPRED_002485 [Cyphobasidiales sp. Tagirdzhanova-0007]